MPSVSARQHRAFGAAAGGKGRLGIPVKVAKEALKADKKRGKKFKAKLKGR